MNWERSLGYAVSSAAVAILLFLTPSTVSADFNVDNRLTVVDSSGNLILDAQSSSVQIGRGGGAATRRDTDLIVYDPFHSALNERAFDFNASISDLRIGSGTASNSGDDGDIFLEDGLGQTSFHLDGSTGNITNSIDGNGVVKAWARIKSDGTVASCFRCNTNPAQTRRLSRGRYEVDFSPLAGNIRSRPRSATLDQLTGNSPRIGFIGVASRNGDASSVVVRTTNQFGDQVNQAFTLLIY